MKNEKKISDKSTDNQSEARIFLAYNNNCHFVAAYKFCEMGPRARPENTLATDL